MKTKSFRTVAKNITASIVKFVALVCGAAALIVAFDTIKSRFWSPTYKAPEIGNPRLGTSGPYVATYDKPGDGNRYDLFAYPSKINPKFTTDSRYLSAPVLYFSITNPKSNEAEMIIANITLRPRKMARRVFVGNGPMVSGAKFMGYSCTFRPNVQKIAAVYTGDDDFVKLEPGETDLIRVFIYSEAEGLYDFHAECEYRIGKIDKTVPIGHDFEAFYFFASP